MKFKIDQPVFEILPNLAIAIPVIRGFDNTKEAAEALGLLRGAEANLRQTQSLDSFWKDIRVTAYVDAFRTFGTDPEIRRPTHIALAIRVLEGGELPDINPIVNIYNAMSIKYLTPFGGENLDVLKGDFRLFIAKGGETWFPIGGDKSKPAIAGELVWGDDVDLSTRALNWRQCDRTKMTDATTNGFFIMDGFTGINRDVMEEASAEFMKEAKRLCGGLTCIFWLDAARQESEGIEI